MSTIVASVDDVPRMIKRGRGRPKKYANEEEQKEARRAQVLLSVRKYRQRLAQTRQSSNDDSSPATTSVATGGNKDPAVGILGKVTLVASSTQDETNTSYNLAELVRQRRKTLASTKPPVLASKDTAIFLEGLLRDFMTYTQNSETWWPFFATTKISGLAGRLVGRSHIAACASTIGIAKNDTKLIKLGEMANIDTIRLLRQYTTDTHVGQLAVPLIVMTHHLISYEFKEFLKGDSAVPTTMTWALHGRASNTIACKAGPDAFRSGLGVRILLGMLPQAVMDSTGHRVGMAYASREWLSMLEAMQFPTFKDSIWPLAVHVPSLIQEYDMIIADSIVAGDPATVLNLQGLHARIMRLNASLDNWLSLFPNGKGTTGQLDLYWSSISQTPATDIFFPRIHFSTVCAAQITSLYWTFKLLLAILASDTQERLAQICDSAISPLTAHETPLKYAYLICRSNAYWQQVPRVSSTTMCSCVSWPLRVAWRWFDCRDRYSKETQWCAEASKRLRKDPIGKIGEYVVDFAYAPRP